MKDQPRPAIRFHVELEIDEKVLVQAYRVILIMSRIIILIIVLVKLVGLVTGTYVA